MKSPAFQFYVRDWLASSTVQRMSGDEVKAYMFLLSCAWLEPERATLPNDDRDLAKLARVTPKKWRRIKAGVMSAFILKGDRWVSDRLFEVSEVQKDRAVAGQIGGKNTQQKRKQSSSKSQANDEAKTNPSSSSSPSIISSNEEISSPKKRKKEIYYPPDSDEAKCAYGLFYDGMRINNPICKEPNWQEWCHQFHLMFAIDKRPVELTFFLIRWCQRDDFWKVNILSASKFREQFDKLFVKAKSEWEKSQKNKIVSV